MAKKPTERSSRASSKYQDFPTGLPGRDTLIKYINDNPDHSTKRDLARAFQLRGDERIELKNLIRSLEDDGLLSREKKSFTRPGKLPPITLLDITTRDVDGGLIGRPAEWKFDDKVAPAVLIRASKQTGRNGKKQPTAGVGDRVLAKVFPSKQDTGPAYSARVIKIIDKGNSSSLGVLRLLDDENARVEPIDRKSSELDVDLEISIEAADGDLVEIEVNRSGRYGLKRAKIVKVLGSVDSEKAVSMIAVHANNIPYIFPEEVLAEAEKTAKVTLNKREDWRHLPFVTIDPADAKDHDDAVYAETDENPSNGGGHIVHVAIADVSWHIRAGGALDREALKRGNSTYFPDRVVPMLPEKISNDLCSLREGVDRPALAVRMIFSSQGKKISQSFHRVLIKSAASLSYQTAQRAFDGDLDDQTQDLNEPALQPLLKAYRAMCIARDKRQPLALDMPERKLVLDSSGKIDKVIVPERLEAHRLIEECMIQANVAAGETLDSRKQPLIFRIHDGPSMAKLEVLREFLGTLDIPLVKGGNIRANNFNQILAAAKEKPFERMVNEMVLRSQSQAVYSPDNIGHFGLNLMKYAHFTSPIRRYADLIVHRALVGSLGLGEGGITPDEEKELADISVSISTTERRSMMAERNTVDRLVAYHLCNRIGESFDGRVGGVTKSGLFISLPQFGADGFIPISTLGAEYYLYDEAHQALVGEASGLGYRLGDTVEVQLAEAKPVAGALLFKMQSEGTEMPRGMRSFNKSIKGRKRTKNKRTGKRPSRRK